MVLSCDVVVVGAGNGGLVAAAAAAKTGLRTLLLEKHNLPGGSATSFRRGRFEFEPSLHEMAGYGPADNPGDVRQIFEGLGVEADMLPVKDAFRAIVTGPEGYDVTMPIGIENFVMKMEQLVPGSAQSTSAFFKLASDVSRALDYLGKGPPDPAVLRSGHMDFMRVASQPVSAVLDALGMPEKAQSILCTYWVYMGMPKSEFSFIHYALMVYRYVSMGAYIPGMRSHELSLAIEKRIRDLGGDVWYNCPVTKFVIKGGVCAGVETGHGRIYAKQVISNIYPTTVFGSMADPGEVPEGEAKRSNARTFGSKGFCVYLGLCKSPEELGIKDYSVFVSGTPDSGESSKRMHTMDGNDFFIMNCLNIVNPGCSPKGTSLLWATQLFKGDTWDDVKPENYKKVKNELAKGIIDKYEAVTGIKISDCIEEISVATPMTFARYLNSPTGSIYGYHGAGWDDMLSRIMSARDERWVKGLKFCGGHALRLLGYSSTYLSGYQTAQLAAADIKEGR